MPVNYRVSGDVDITPAIGPGRHDWSMLERGIIRDENAKARKAAEEAAAQAAKAKQAAEEAKYAPEFVNDIEYNDAIQKKGQEVLRYSADAYKKGTIGSPEYNFNIGQMKNQTALISGKAKAAIDAAKQSYQNVDQLPRYVDKTKLNTKIYDAAHPKQKDTTSLKLFNQPFNDLPPERQKEVLSRIPKGINPDEVDMEGIDPKFVADIPTNYYDAINSRDMYADKIKDLGVKVHTSENMFGVADPNDGTALGQMIRSDSTKAKFFKPLTDKKGNVTRWVPGVTDEAAAYMLDNDPEVKGDAEHKYQKYLEAETAARISNGVQGSIGEVYNDVKRNTDARKFMLDYAKRNMEQFNEVSADTGLKQGYKYDKSDGSKDEEFSATKVTNQKRNFNVEDPNTGKVDVRTGDVPEEYRLAGKKIDTPLMINSSKIIEEGTNRKIKGAESLGDKKVYATRVMLLPTNAKTNQIVQGSTENLKKNPDIIWKQYLGGTMDDKKKVEGKEVDVKKSVIIPYDEVSNDVKAKFGFDLDEREASEISDLELTSIIKQKYPNASPQEKVKIFNQIRGR